jgi:hypothetical protein
VQPDIVSDAFTLLLLENDFSKTIAFIQALASRRKKEN